MKKRAWFFVAALAAALGASSVGCGPKAPADMPETHPFKVKVVNGSDAIADVDVFFIATSGSVTISGKTDKNGVAEITSTLQGYTADGAPAGDYKVTCTKDPQPEHWKTPAELAAMSVGEQSEYHAEYEAKRAEMPREIPEVWKDFDRTPLSATVSAGGGEVTFDVAELGGLE